jgi:hypothetical protein
MFGGKPIPESWRQFDQAAHRVADAFPSTQYAPAKSGAKSYTSANLGLGSS